MVTIDVKKLNETRRQKITYKLWEPKKYTQVFLRGTGSIDGGGLSTICAGQYLQYLNFAQTNFFSMIYAHHTTTIDKMRVLLHQHEVRTD